ncbi:MAG: hypothetical protein HY767_00770, partial [Candidatus Omnitrophica bacterium]|nr:hypothetical protein [Candidatus Omnitrophota bacterium]
DVWEAVFKEPEKHFKHWPVRSETREEVERPLDKIDAEKVRKIFVFGHKGYGQEKLGEDLILYAHFVPLILKKFPNAQIHMAIDYQNIFSSERYRGRVFPVSDALYPPVNELDSGKPGEPMEPRDGHLPAIPVPAGAIKKVMNRPMDTTELGRWLMDEHYDLVFDFTPRHLSGYFANVKDTPIPTIFSNMNIILMNTGIEVKNSPMDFEIQMLDSAGFRLLKGREDVDQLTRDGQVPVFWEMVLRVYRALGLLPERFDLQTVNEFFLPLHDEEKTWVASNLVSLLIRKGMSPELARAEVLAGRHKFIYVNIFSQSSPDVFTEEQWVSLLSRMFIPDARGKRSIEEDVYLVFSRGGFKDHQNQKALNSLLARLERILGPEKSKFLLKAPENLSIGRVQEIMQTMDYVITPDTGFSHLATALDIPQTEFLLFPKDGSRWKTYRRKSLVVDRHFLQALQLHPDAGMEKILEYIRASLAAAPLPRKNSALKISAVQSV